MSWYTATFLIVASCWTSVLPQDDTLYIPMRLVRREPGAIESIVPRTNPYHPLVRFRTLEVRPAYFFVLDKPPEPEERPTAGDLIQFLTTIYEEEYHEPPPTKELSKGIIRFGIIR